MKTEEWRSYNCGNCRFAKKYPLIGDIVCDYSGVDYEVIKGLELPITALCECHEPITEDKE